ncbi:MAG: iron-containing alcohol dehydrogenase [Propionibacteriaceae bacterium]|jgi:alcohol dehydrogenase class IV|nr:iron-containing alcohol dehydrogenase [Propionibacteriaceae bacterium]
MTGTFTYANPAAISYGPGSLDGLAAIVGSLGARRPLLVSTAPVLDNPALLDLVLAALPVAPVATAAIGGHAPLDDVNNALTARFAADADLVISLGGGGPIDAAKGVARGALAAAARVGAASQTGMAADTPPNRVPHVALPTTLAAAELSWRAGFSNTDGDKVGFADRGMLPCHVFYEPRLAVHTPTALWLATGVRALDHAVEGYLADGDHPLSDVLAVESVARLLDALPRTAADPSDIAARGDAQVAAWFSYTLPLASMTGLSHQMGKQIGARHRIGHGDASALLLPHVMRYRATLDPVRADTLSRALDRRLADGTHQAADRVAGLIAQLGLPQHVAAFGVTPADLDRAAAEIATPKHPAGDLSAVYRAAL